MDQSQPESPLDRLKAVLDSPRDKTAAPLISNPVPSLSKSTISGLVQPPPLPTIQKSTEKGFRSTDFKLLTLDNLKSTCTKGVPEFYKLSWSLAAYCGIEDKRDFHRLQFSWVFLDAFPVWLRYNRGKGFLCILQDKIGEDSRELDDFKDLPTDLDDILKTYPDDSSLNSSQYKMHMDYGLAAIIRSVSRNLQRKKVDEENLDTELLLFQNAQKRAWLNTSLDTTAFPNPLPELFQWDVGEFPHLGPFAQEILAERYNRINLIFYSLRFALSPSKAKSFRLLDPSKCTLFTKHDTIPLDLWPYWMRPHPQSTSISLAAPLQYPPKTFDMQWARSSGTREHREALEYHLMDEDGHVQSEGLMIPPIDSRINTDPRLCVSAAQWRDTLRVQYNLWKLRLELDKLDIILPDKDKVNIFGEGECSWNAAQVLFSNEDNIVIQMKLTVLADDVEHPIIEWEGPPPNISSFITVTDQLRLKLADRVDPDQSEKVDVLNNNIGLPLGVEAIHGKFAETDGYDLEDSEQLSKFQNLVFNDPRVTGQRSPKDVKTESIFNAKASKEQKSFFQTMSRDHTRSALAQDNNGDEDLGTALPKSAAVATIQNAFMTSRECTGPYVEDSRVLLGMVQEGTHLNTGLPIFKCSLLPNCGMKFLDSQITAAAFMLQKSFGVIPHFPGQGVDTTTMQSARKRLRCAATSGVILAEGTGMGKTLATLLAFALSVEAIISLNSATIRQSQTGLERVVSHIPSLLVCPSSLVLSQWIKEIRSNFCTIHLIIWADSKPSESFLQPMWVSSTQMKHPTKQFPINLKYIFDDQDPRASRTLIITLPGTHSSRSLLEDRNPEKKGWESSTSWWAGRFRFVMVDEAHKLRHDNTKFWHSIGKLNAQFHWFITASPIVNTEKDVIALLKLMWPTILDSISNDKAASDWWHQQDDTDDHTIISKASNFTDRRQLAALNPKAVECLFGSDDLTLKAELFSQVSKLVILSRNKGSVLRMNEVDESEVLDLSPIMKEHRVQTLDIKYKEQEETESQYWHMLYATQYDVALQNSIPNAPDKVSRDKTAEKIPAIVSSLRKLSITSASTKLARLDYELDRLGASSLVESMDAFRQRKVGLDWFIRLVWREEDGPYPQTRRDKLAFLSDGSPLCRWLFSEYRDWVIGAKRKLLLTEDTPFIAWYWEVMSTAIGIQVKVMYSSTSTTERHEMMELFNRKGSSLQVLILLYSVGGAQGTNFDGDCWRAAVMNVGLNSASEIQTWGRLIRISQKETVTIKRAVVRNSHSETRECRQMDKSVVQLACQTGVTPVRDILIKLLNKYNFEIKEAREEIENLTPNPSVGPDSDTGIDEDEDEDIDDANSSNLNDRDQSNSGEMDQMIDQNEEYATYGLNFDESDDDPDDDDDQNGTNDNLAEYLDNFETFGQASQLTRGDMKRRYKSFTLQGKQEFDNATAYLQLLSRFDPDKIYTLEDLKDNEVLERGIRLLYRERYGMNRDFLRLGIHIKYDKISRTVFEKHQADMKILRQAMAKKAAAVGLNSIGANKRDRQQNSSSNVEIGPVIKTPIIARKRKSDVGSAHTGLPASTASSEDSTSAKKPRA